MAVYTNLKEVSATMHGMFESSRLKASDCGNIYDAVVIDGEEHPIDIDNGVAIKMGEYTGDGLQTRFATIAAIGDKIAVTGSPANVKDAFTKMQAADYNFFVEAGKPIKAYEVENEIAEVFAVAKYQFTSEKEPTVGSFVVVDGKGGWTALADMPEEATYGFIGKVHSIASNEFYPMIRIQVVKNVQA